jgi:uncharacterized protein
MMLLDRHNLDEIREQGYCHLPNVLSAADCDDLAVLFDQPEKFRSTIVMERHGYGKGQYSYFANPLPEKIINIRHQYYEELVPLANESMHRMGIDIRYPPSLAEFHKYCAERGQSKPTPLILNYDAGGYNRLHRDLYGDTLFPYQMVIMLSQKETDFHGGEFVLVENWPRQQSIAHVLTPDKGDMIIFPVSERPVTGTKGDRRISVRHGVSVIRTGHRLTVGIIFHQAS